MHCGPTQLLKGQNTKPFTTENEFSALETPPTDLNDICYNAFGKLSNVHSARLGPLKPYPARFRAMVGKLEPRSAEMSSLIINEIVIFGDLLKCKANAKVEANAQN